MRKKTIVCGTAAAFAVTDMDRSIAVAVVSISGQNRLCTCDLTAACNISGFAVDRAVVVN
jgi:hypothetical protein